LPEELTDNVERSRFEFGAHGASGFIDYRRSGTTLFLNHAEVPAALAGHGVGTQMVTEALELIRRRGERIVPVCSFVEAFVRRHPAYADLCVQ
jgi:uncharacterized protein